MALDVGRPKRQVEATSAAAEIMHDRISCIRRNHLPRAAFSGTSRNPNDMLVTIAEYVTEFVSEYSSGVEAEPVEVRCKYS